MSRFKSSHPEHQIYEDGVSLHALSEELVSGNGDAFEIPGNIRGVLVHCHHNITATGDALDLIDIFAQTLFGTFWVDVVHFTQIDGIMGTAVEMFDKVCANVDQDHFDVVADPIAADGKRHIIGSKWRVRWVIVDGGGAGTHAFTFSVDLHLM